MNSLKSEIYSNSKLVTENVVSLDIVTLANKIPYAQVVICDGDKKNKNPVEMSGETCFKPGQEIEIALSNKDGAGAFKGIVLKQRISASEDGIFLTVDIKDKAHKLSLKRNSAVFENIQDKQIITDIAKPLGITVECSEKTYEHKQVVRYYCTDWDFIVSRAEANGLLVFVENGVLKLKKPESGNAATLLDKVIEFEMEADMSEQYKEVESRCWDIESMANSSITNTNTVDPKGKHDFAKLSGAMGADKRVLVNGIYCEEKEMELWANAWMTKNRLSMLRGRVSIDGNPLIKIGDTIKIDKAGDIFNSSTVVTGIRHRIDKEGWVTDLQCGLSPEWFYSKYDIVDKPAAGLLPGINGLQIGVVEAFPSDGDPQNFHRIKIRIPAVHDTDSVIWARLLFPYAGDARGMFLVPEEGDEVVIGFFNDDPRHAVVLGSLYNGTTEPPLQFTDTNNEKGFITRNDIKMVFTDEDNKEKIEISTPAGNKVLIEDEKGISVTDKNENEFILNDTGTSLTDKNKNKVVTDDKGIAVEDTNSNKCTYSNQGIELTDSNGNAVTLSSAGVEIKDMNGNEIVLKADGITIKTEGKVNVEGSAVNMN